MKMQLPLIKQISLAVVLAGSSSFLFAQDTTTHVTLVQTVKPLDGGSGFRRWSLGINGGVLAPVVGTGGYNDFTKWQPTLGYGAYVKYQVTHMLGLQLDYVGGSLKGNNDNKEGDGTSATSPYSAFKTDMTGAGSISIVYSFSNINWMHRRNIIIPYFSIGAGAAKFKNPVLTLDDGTTKPYTTPKGINQFFVPVGAGLKINVATGVNIDLGYRMFFVDGDNIDGYKVYLGHMDHFSYGFAGLEFSLGRKSKQQLIVDNPVYDLHEAVTRENEALRARLEAENEAARKEDQAKLAEVAALRDQIGKLTADADGDGVSDYFDKCPGTPAGTKVDGSGCALPQPPQVEEKVIITEDDRRLVRDAIQNLEFDLGKASLAPSSYSSLDKVAGILVSKHFSLKLAGHTDNVGSQDNNMRLSKDRAESVKAYLVSKGANPSRIEATGYGMTQPIASNKTAEGRQKNRRVEFTLY
jgi:OOP family OmpA-OmpF porin